MADTLRRLVNTSSFSVLQEKLESWYKDYHVISCDQNLNRCCELVELTSKVQGQLFTILSLTAQEGGQYAGVDTLKSRLLPWLGTCFTLATSTISTDTSLSLIQAAEKDKKIRELSLTHESDLQKMETQLCSTRLQLDSVRQELMDTQQELDETKNKSATTLLATEDEILQLRAELQVACDQTELYKRKLDMLDDCERQIHLLKEEMSFLAAEKSLLQEKLVRGRSPSAAARRSRSSSPRLRNESPSRARLTSSSRRARLISRFSDLYAIHRLEAQNVLRHYVDDVRTVQRIIFIAVVEAFQAAKLAFRQFRLRVRKTLSSTHMGPESLENAMLDYIIRNLDLYDVQASVNEVINSMNVNPKISFPAEVNFVLISGLIRETCHMAFAMQTLDPPLELAFSSDGELYSESKYRRSYDSEFTAPLVALHVWPALMEGDSIVVKGEAVTMRGALWRSRSRSCSPVRSSSASPIRALGTSRSRSPSPGALSVNRL
ncbi:mitochondria-eating protein isoform X2 [Brienomyrus brachyistius]|uniref:mitochondria-eating protein isoform X2 n=1 Tax=Brienomyrus brachyistius TaxID=42636 RepID=UPI0020B17A56|nr:mitochondria-eating protein isoform X2 [Brienomyrus brachyistius]